MAQITTTLVIFQTINYLLNSNKSVVIVSVNAINVKVDFSKNCKKIVFERVS